MNRSEMAHIHDQALPNYKPLADPMTPPHRPSEVTLDMNGVDVGITGHYSSSTKPLPQVAGTDIPQREVIARRRRAIASEANVVPLSLLGRWPATVECPGCWELTFTNTKVKSAKGTHWMAFMFLCTTGIGVFIPYICDSFKNVEHSCLRCGKKLATIHYGSGTEAHFA